MEWLPTLVDLLPAEYHDLGQKIGSFIASAAALAIALGPFLARWKSTRWITHVLDALGANRTPERAKLRIKQLEGQVAGLTGEVAQLSTDKARSRASMIPPVEILCLSLLVALGGCSWREKPVEWPTALLRCAPQGDALVATVQRELGSADRVTDAMRSAVTALAREHGPGAVACALGEVISLGTNELVAKNAALRPNPYGGPEADNACEIARELRLPFSACEL